MLKESKISQAINKDHKMVEIAALSCGVLPSIAEKIAITFTYEKYRKISVNEEQLEFNFGEFK